MLALRRAHPVLRREAFYTNQEIDWFNPDGQPPDWLDPLQKSVACLVRGQDGPDLYLMFNADTQAIVFILPPSPLPAAWCVAVDTAKRSPSDFRSPWGEAILEKPASYLIESHSSAVLVAH